MSDEDWVRAAIADDSPVVELLMLLRHAPPPPPPPKRESRSPALPLEWTVRQRRSKMVVHAKKKDKATPTGSPTTPLSWSGATSVSGGGGCEECCGPPPKHPEATRSTVTGANGATTSRRPRKKKTLAELKEEEIFLVKERRDLKRDLARLHVTLEKQRATNERLKRLKLDLEFEPAPDSVAMVASVEETPDQTRQELLSCDPISKGLHPDVGIDDPEATQPLSPNGSSTLQHEVITLENNFLLPDLNLPIEVS